MGLRSTPFDFSPVFPDNDCKIKTDSSSLLMTLKERLQERRWLARLNRGDASAFAEVYECYAERIYRHVRLRVNQRETAEDIASTVFLKAWAQLADRARPVRALKAFLFTIANNLIVDFYRSRGRTETMELTTELDPPDEAADAAQILLSLETAQRQASVRQALRRLNPFYRALIVWRYVDELSVKEIQRLSGKSRDAVYVGLYRALKALKKALQHAT